VKPSTKLSERLLLLLDRIWRIGRRLIEQSELRVVRSEQRAPVASPTHFEI
jgi:hypothetical protein